MASGTEGKRTIHYAWLILGACCIMQGASLGLINNCVGVFFTPVCEDLGFEMGRFTLYRTFYALSSAFALPFVAKSLQRFDVRIVISAASVVLGLCSAAMGMSSQLWHWYVIGTVQGIASSFLCFLPAPILLGNWFYKKTGMAVGISAACSGLAGMLGSSALGFLIPGFGWRASYVIVGLLSTGLTLPVSVFILRYRPEDLGMKAYGAEEAPQTETAGPSDPSAGRKEAGPRPAFSDLVRQPVFYVALTAYACSLAGSYLNNFLTSCGSAVGLAMTAATMMTTLALFGNMISKLFLGRASDSFGAIRTLEVSALIAIAGHALLFAGIPGGMMAGALLFGITPPLSSVMLPLFCRLFWKGDTYGSAYSYVSMFGTLLASPFNMLFGTFYDRTGSYRLTIFTSAALIAIVLILAAFEGRALAKKRD